MSVRKAASAGLWSSVDVLLRQGVNFLVSVILARLLLPADFGIIALLTFFSSLSAVFVQGGLSTALVRQQETSREEESAIFWLNLGSGIVVAGLLLLAAPLVARFYGYPILSSLMPFAAAQVVLSALASVQTALLERHFRFRLITISGISSSIVSGVLGIVSARAGAGVWALAIQLTVQPAVYAAVLWAASDWRPLFVFRFRAIAAMLRFSVYLSLSSLLEVINNQGYALIIGKLHGPRSLGFLNRANGTQQFATGILTSVISRIALPLFASRVEEPEALRRGVQLAVRVSMLVNMPAMVGLALVADVFTRVLFGDKWLPAAPLLSLLALGNILTPLHVINLQVMLAQGRSDRFLTVEVVKKVFGLTGMVIGSIMGVLGLAYAAVIVSVISFVINAYYTGTTLKYGALAQARDIAVPALMALVMTLAVLLARSMIDWGPAMLLASLTTVGAIAYGCASVIVLVCWPDFRKVIAAATRRSTPDLPPLKG